jgi:hypothetical protein
MIASTNPPVFVFISYSSKDKTFARKIDATLAANGVSAFLDDRDILVGDSIPERIYESIAAATHVIYILSRHSQQSKWVQDEIAAAKMRQNDSGTRLILPVKIDSSELPASIRHIKYADFTDWADHGSYAVSFQQLLVGLGLQLKVPGSSELRFFLANHARFADLESTATMLGGLFEGALESDRAELRSDYQERGTGTRSVFKWNIIEGPHLKKLHDLRRTLVTYGPTTDSGGRMVGILTALDNLITVLEGTSRNNAQRYDVIADIKNASYRLAGVINEFRQELTGMLAAGFEAG